VYEAFVKKSFAKKEREMAEVQRQEDALEETTSNKTEKDTKKRNR